MLINSLLINLEFSICLFFVIDSPDFLFFIFLRREKKYHQSTSDLCRSVDLVVHYLLSAKISPKLVRIIRYHIKSKCTHLMADSDVSLTLPNLVKVLQHSQN